MTPQWAVGPVRDRWETRRNPTRERAGSSRTARPTSKQHRWTIFIRAGRLRQARPCRALSTNKLKSCPRRRRKQKRREQKQKLSARRKKRRSRILGIIFCLCACQTAQRASFSLLPVSLLCGPQFITLDLGARLHRPSNRHGAFNV